VVIASVQFVSVPVYMCIWASKLGAHNISHGLGLHPLSTWWSSKRRIRNFI